LIAATKAGWLRPSGRAWRHLFDDGEFDRLDLLFTASVRYDVTAFGGGVLQGIEAIRAATLALGDRNPVGHHVTNVVLTEQPDGSVRARSKGIGIYADGTAGSVTYEDEIVRTGDGWRIDARTVAPRRARHQQSPPRSWERE
jgi:hypothetical protein